MTQPKTLGELKRSGYKPLSAKAELRKNLIRKMLDREPLFPGIFGFEETVIPQVQNAILAGQDMIFLGERGQAKTRLIRSLTSLLDPMLPCVKGSEINDDPFAAISKYARDMVTKHGDDTPIAWVSRDDRYGEKLATPDVTTPELIGEVDPIKVAEGAISLMNWSSTTGWFHAPTAASSVSTSFPTCLKNCRLGCSISCKSAMSRFVAFGSACRLTFALLRVPIRKTIPTVGASSRH